jgi:hypothetical protein
VLIAMLRRTCVALGNSAGSPTTPGLRTKPSREDGPKRNLERGVHRAVPRLAFAVEPHIGGEIEYEVSYLSKLAEFMAPVPLAKVTKAVLRDFRLEERRRLQPGESCVKILRAVINIDAFLAETRRKKKTK